LIWKNIKNIEIIKKQLDYEIMKTGIYFYENYHPATKTFSKCHVRVEVLHESAASYQIRLPSKMTSWVRKHHVKYILDDSVTQIIPYACMNDSIRLPYKD
jgi:hypothetical protein